MVRVVVAPEAAVGLGAVAGHPVAEAAAMAGQEAQHLARLLHRTAVTHPRLDILPVRARLATAATEAQMDTGWLATARPAMAHLAATGSLVDYSAAIKAIPLAKV
jgi:hypothetical protein